MASHKLYSDETPSEVKSAKGLHLLTQNTPNGQAVQIFLEELHDVYGLEWTTTLIDISTNDQKKDWFLALNPNGILALRSALPVLTAAQDEFQHWWITLKVHHSLCMRPLLSSFIC